MSIIVLSQNPPSTSLNLAQHCVVFYSAFELRVWTGFYDIHDCLFVSTCKGEIQSFLRRRLPYRHCSVPILFRVIHIARWEVITGNFLHWDVDQCEIALYKNVSVLVRIFEIICFSTVYITGRQHFPTNELYIQHFKSLMIDFYLQRF